MKKIKVLIVDDSVVMQNLLREILSIDPEIQVVGTASDPLEAREMIKKTNPDVITLDVIMPKMNGIVFLKNIMRLRPMPVIMISSLTQKNSDVALEALAAGAVDYMAKPTRKELENIIDYERALISMIKKAKDAGIQGSGRYSQIPARNVGDPGIIVSQYKQAPVLRNTIIGIGASVGGIEAIEFLLRQWSGIMPAILVTQHIKKELNISFQQRLNKLTPLTVVTAEESLEILPGHVYISNSGTHFAIKKSPHYFCTLLDSAPVNGHKPSVDVLFKSMAKEAGANAIGILLTGMGVDGAEGLKSIKDSGGVAIAQDKETSVVWGMPGAAVKIGATHFVLPLEKIPQQVLTILDAKSQL